MNEPCCLIEGQLYKVGLHGKVFVRRDVVGWCLTHRFTPEEIRKKYLAGQNPPPLDELK